MRAGLAAAVVLASFGAGVLAGRGMREAGPAAGELSGRAGGSRRPLAPSLPPRTVGAAARPSRPPAPLPVEGTSARAAAEASRPPIEIERALARIATEDEEPGAIDESVLRLRGDPAALAAAIERFRSETDPQKLMALATLLGQIKEPSVEALALELARSGDLPHRLAALELLDRFETPAAIPVASEILAREGDPALLQAAIYALPDPSGVAMETARAVDRELARLSREAPDAETRRRAVERLWRWAATPEDEAAIVASLRDDPDASVRCGAAFALGMRRTTNAAAIRALADTLARREEDPSVRWMCWQALGRAGPLPPEALAAYQAFEIESEAR
jgi:HEAT repeat protein